MMEKRCGHCGQMCFAEEEKDLSHCFCCGLPIDDSLESEIVAEPIIGWRIWHVAKDVSLSLNIADIREMEHRWKEGRNPFEGFSAPYLQSVGVNALWARPFIEACCNSSHLAASSSTRPYGTTGPTGPAGSPWHHTVSVFQPGHTSRESHPVPEQHCTCGIWALKNETQIIDAIVDYKSGRMAFGSVQIWGKIIECTEGYRAQYAKPLSITVVGVSQEEADEMAAAYECEVGVAADFPPAVEGATRRKKELASASYWLTKASLSQNQNLVSSGGFAANPPTQPELPAGEPPPKKRILDLFGGAAFQVLKWIALIFLILPSLFAMIPYMIVGLTFMGRVGSKDWWFAHDPMSLLGRLIDA